MKRFGQGEKLLSYNQCSKELTAMKKKNEWLKEPDKFALQNALKDLADDYRRFFEKQKEQKYSNKKIAYLKKKNQEPTIYDLYGHPKFKLKKNRRQSYRTNFTKENIKFLGKYIQLPKLDKVKCKFSRNVEGKILSTTISKNSSGKYFVSICCQLDDPIPFNKTGSVIGIDLGIKDFAITSNGIKYENPKYFSKSEKRLATLQRKLSRKSIGSSNRNKARIKVAK